jgi:hypothetical protein
MKKITIEERQLIEEHKFPVSIEITKYSGDNTLPG